MLKPSLTTQQLRPPQPPETRRVWCPICGSVGHVSVRAISMRCASCTAPLQPGDLEVGESLQGDLTVLGHVSVRPQMAVVGRLTCGELTNEGEIRGAVRVGGCVDLRQGSRTTGQLVCQSLHITRGARLRVLAAIGTLSDLPRLAMNV
jgi:hypothetical protein